MALSPARFFAGFSGLRPFNKEMTDFFNNVRIAPVLLPLPLNKTYDYQIPADTNVQAGSYVRVSFSGQTLIGVVWSSLAPEIARDIIDKAKLKTILDVQAHVPPMTPELMRLVTWVSDYTLAPLGAVLRMCFGSSGAFLPDVTKIGYVASDVAGSADLRLSAIRRRVLAVLDNTPPLSAAVLGAEAGCGSGVIRAMAKAGLLVEHPISSRPSRPAPDPDGSRPVLSSAQTEAALDLRRSIAGKQFEVVLLDGVTGSGKTEVYFEAVAEALAIGRQALVLLPEIALSAQWQARFERRFGCPPAVWHSEVSSAERRRVWRDIAEGKASVVVGARSAMFLPFVDLGVVIVDEEHDSSYKQEDGVIYHGRDMVIVRARFCDAPVILASATPSIESLVNVERGRYRRINLPSRHGGAALPKIDTIDLRQDRPARQRFLAPSLIEALSETLARGEQAMLFLNRRGYAPLTLCRTCGYRVQCPSCTAWLVEHRLIRRLVCHHCGYAAPLPEICPACEDRHSFVPCGPGVERLAEEVTERFPDARTAIMASDTLERPSAIAELLSRVASREIDLLIGTQIMAKGHHFPMLTLVGVVDADLGLAGGDLRAAERTYQLLHQVAGRAGREERPGRVLLQTHEPDHPVMQALRTGQRDRFMAAEAAARHERHLPPYGRLAAVIVSAPAAEAADMASTALARAAPHLRGIDVLGPAPAPLAILRGRHRRRFLVKAERPVNIQAVISAWLSAVRTPSSTRIQVDIDPYSFL